MKTLNQFIFVLSICLTISATSAIAGSTFHANVVEIQSTGTSFEDAKKKAFNQAIEQVAGVLIVGDKESYDFQLTKDFTGSYSSGYIEDYEVMDSYQDFDGTWNLTVAVKVASSKISQRMAVENNNNSEFIDGEKVKDKIDSLMAQRLQGDQLLSVVMESYPSKAYIINKGKTEIKVDNQRQTHFDVPYEVSFNKFWIDALNEAVANVSVEQGSCNTLTMILADGFIGSKNTGRGTKDLAKSICGAEPDIRIFTPAGKNFFPRAHSYTLPDNETLNVINRRLQSNVGQNLAVQISLLDFYGKPIDLRCTKIDNQLFVNYSKPRGTYNYNSGMKNYRPNLMGQNKVHGIFRVHIKNTNELENLSRIKLQIVESC